MIAQLALAAALGANPPVIRAADARAPRYVRLQLDVTAYGVAGRGTLLVDRVSGAFVRRFDAGPVSEGEGWDGARAWRADATGMPRIEGNVDERGAIVAWAHALAPAAFAQPCGCGTRAPEISVDPARGFVTAFVRHIGAQTERTSFDAYRAAGSLVVPFTFADSSDNGTWTARVRSVETPRSVPASAFAPPSEPRDFTLHDVEALQMVSAVPPVIGVAVNGGPPLRFLLDTGGQNVIAPDAARRAGLQPVGSGTVGGAGARLVKTQYATARRVTIGGAELRDQPFVVLDFGKSAPFDGIVGYELLARLAVRIDFVRAKLWLATDARELSGDGVTVPFVFEDRQPQVDGALDGIPGAMTIDTGSESAVDVNAPFVQAHDLRTRYHAVASDYPISGVGGPIHAYYAHGDELRLGALRVTDVPLLLTDAVAGAEANPTVAANVGTRILRRYAVVLDYRRNVIRFEPPNVPRATATPAAPPA
ncbi:MAG TPA: retroviral-like aspartic protease family protein [Candidatus Elarobacter sp.]|jgi:predicted aspartyl protease|nr:retroviral-like aspartic protease family protein [Candidatus Elarobacter sp.]